MVGFPLTRLTPPHCCAGPKSGFQRSYVVFVFVIVDIVDIGETDDHHCLIFLFIIVIEISTNKSKNEI